MRKRLALVAPLVMTLAACGGDTKLDCTAMCNVSKCYDDSASCETDAQCTCNDDIYNDQIKAAYNDCGSKSTCGDVQTCWNASKMPAPRQIDQQVGTSCGAYAVQCGLDSTMLCNLWSPSTAFPEGFQVVLSDAVLTDVISCYESSTTCAADATNQCLDAAKPTACAGG